MLTPPGAVAPAEAQRIRAALADLDAALGRLTGSADQDFLRLGNSLGHAVEVFARLGGNLAGLAEQLHSPEAHDAVSGLERAVQGISRMSGGEANRSGSILLQLEEGATEVATRLDQLQRIIGEVGALAINGKIQAALVTAAGVDFSVFTKEIGRLGNLAATSIEQAGGRLGTVRGAVASARQAEADFERNEAKELEAVRARIDASLSVLAERRHRVAHTADSVADKSRRIAQRIGATVAELQINDSVCQRIEHVRTALRAMVSLAAGEPVTEPGCQWLGDEIGEERRALMVGGVLHLQAAQLDGGAGDYRGEVEGLARNLSALAGEAAEILAEAEDAFGGGGGGGLFVAEIESDIRRASELLTAYAEARSRAGSVVGAVSSGFRAMAADLAAIQSIDADMRVMGLNATLKCGRLGNDGRALGVVAHELRACSKRTEDCSHSIAELLKVVLGLADDLAVAAAEGDGGEAGDPVAVMAESMAALSRVGVSMSDALAELRADAGGVSTALTETAAGIEIHHRVGAVAKDGVARLSAIAAGLAAETDLDEALHKDIHRLMQPCYTMDAERFIHQAFAKDDSAAKAMQSKAKDAEDDLDGMFL
ncbi:hypothetical protein H261_12884 [Paramagnetospirillum caucaseum]|uniref:Methyl-accepting transducer domain-containing protein n=1 Tax=Paramagnetospirillum caucaseum TaxID=1244869 RepID=M3AAN0_9PROT|nr:hypothetical protein [Paramagnetospirillum caucaseum]EME69549.1 hypothetical protein H261_12884 [Paramagnetospirillum caucaseum]